MAPDQRFHEIERGRVQGRVHLDVDVTERNRERARLLQLGASVVRKAEGYTVMADPEGNHFCLLDD